MLGMLCVWSIGCHCIECSGHKCAKFDALSDIVVVEIGGLVLKFVTLQICFLTYIYFIQIWIYTSTNVYKLKTGSNLPCQTNCCTWFAIAFLDYGKNCKCEPILHLTKCIDCNFISNCVLIAFADPANSVWDSKVTRVYANLVCIPKSTWDPGT